MKPTALGAGQLTLQYDPDSLGFASTDEVADAADVIGQERAVEAMNFGVEIRSPGFNLFLLGREGTGKQQAILSLLRAKASAQQAPSDWVYVSNFGKWNEPNAMRLPSGRGQELARAMEHVIDDVRASVPAYLGNEENQSRLHALEEEFQQKSDAEMEAIRKRAAERNIALIRTPTGFGFAPMAGDQIIKSEDFEKLPKAERERIGADIEGFQKNLQRVIQQIPRWDKERRDAIRNLLEEMTAIAIGAALEQVTARFSGLPEVLEHLEAVRRDLIENFHAIQAARSMAERAPNGTAQGGPSIEIGGFSRYKVNPLVTRDDGKGAPIVFEDHPTLFNLIGAIEHGSHFGSLVTDFNFIKAGSLHRANGGYLVIDARKLLQQPFSWDALKRALKAGCVTIESPGQSLSLISTLSLEPEPIPLDLKVVLLGDRMLYYLLCELDPEFPDLFKVEADFDDDMVRTDSSERQFIASLASRIRQDRLRPFDAKAILEVLRRAVRLAGDRRKFSINWRTLGDLLHEANFYGSSTR